MILAVDDDHDHGYHGEEEDGYQHYNENEEYDDENTSG